MADVHVNITLTFRTPAPSAAVLEQVLAAVNKHGMPYQLMGTYCDSFDPDEVEN